MTHNQKIAIGRKRTTIFWVILVSSLAVLLWALIAKGVPGYGKLPHVLYALGLVFLAWIPYWIICTILDKAWKTLILSLCIVLLCSGTFIYLQSIPDGFGEKFLSFIVLGAGLVINALLFSGSSFIRWKGGRR